MHGIRCFIIRGFAIAAVMFDLAFVVPHVMMMTGDAHAESGRNIDGAIAVMQDDLQRHERMIEAQRHSCFAPCVVKFGARMHEDQFDFDYRGDGTLFVWRCRGVAC